MRYLGGIGDLNLPMPSLPNGTTLDDAAKQQLVAQVRALPQNQQLIFVDVADETAEGSSRRLKRMGLGAAAGAVLGAGLTLALFGGRRKRS